MNHYAAVVPGLKERFLDGVKAPLHEVIRLGNLEFLDVANNVFAFDSAVVMSNVLSLQARSLELHLDYLAKMDDFGMKWRELRVGFGGIDTIEFGYQDPTLGFPHRTVRKVDLEYAVRNHGSRLSMVERKLRRDHTGAELDCVSFEKEESRLDKVLRKKEPIDLATVWFEWTPTPDPERIVVDRIICREVELEFLTEAASKAWIGRMRAR